MQCALALIRLPCSADFEDRCYDPDFELSSPPAPKHFVVSKGLVTAAFGGRKGVAWDDPLFPQLHQQGNKICFALAPEALVEHLQTRPTWQAQDLLFATMDQADAIHLVLSIAHSQGTSSVFGMLAMAQTLHFMLI